MRDVLKVLLGSSAVFLLLPSTRVDAQVTTATLVGLVSRNSAAVIPGASVVATHEGTGIARESLSDANGEFDHVAAGRQPRNTRSARAAGEPPKPDVLTPGVTVDGTEANSSPEGR